jgi:predicted nucleotide-binding protein
MTKIEAIEKINILIDKLENLQYSNDIIENEYKKWNRKSSRYVESIFGKNSQHINEHNDIIFEDYGSIYCSDANDDLNTFISGKKEMKSLLESFIEEIEEWIDTTITKVEKQIKVKDKTQVFIVHGHDDLAKNEVARFIEKLGLEPIILHEQANGGKTIIEKIEDYTNVDFGIVIYTPCDVGAKAKANVLDTLDLQPRARQNVVFEHGFLNGKLGRHNVCALVKNNLEKPNDISGLVYVDMDNAGAWKMSLAKDLKKSNYYIDMNKLV